MRWLVILLLLCSVASADTGGSMGGGDWSGGGGASTTSPSTTRSSSSSSSRPSTTTTSQSSWSVSSSGSTSTGAIIGVFAGLGVIVIICLVAMNRYERGLREKRKPRLDVTVLRVAIDGRARRFVQQRLAAIANQWNTSSDAGRREMLREVSELLRRQRDVWVYGGAVNEPMRALHDAKTTFDRHVDDARSSFREEVIRNVDGVTTTRVASEYAPRSDEGEGLILVSIVIASNDELTTVKKIGDGDSLRRALQAAAEIPAQALVAVEVIWQPAVDGDRLSSMELEAKYPPPGLVRLPGAIVGKTFCTHCSGPYPSELVSCPHCGAPASRVA